MPEVLWSAIKSGFLCSPAPVGVPICRVAGASTEEMPRTLLRKTRHGTAKRFLEPTDISNLALWLDAADTSTISESFNLVSQWNDKSGNGNYHAVAQSGEELQLPVDNINGKNVLTWENSQTTKK